MSLDLDAIKARTQAATEGPWWFDEDDNCWRLHGVHARIPADPIGIPEQIINHQILKAPKRGTTYAEYWPNKADAAFIQHSREDIPALIAEVERLQARVEQRARNEARLMNAIDAIAELTRDTDGGDVDPDADIPVGELRRVLAEAVTW